ncbi:XRE family transcriptional regulator [Syntrophotalea acetylenica]|uniref:Fis family transcriptional regulator n=1 Tax=Syntrophotalea acetylenica TaxID=29542 RepID=A0A1L3GCQ5_SYNAC|nr:XRE family transcriptional regulator [Syntrophotalea acetylenica]APG23723.1 Fis family transcriptional regulator [Syntrophotalea acetylenica]APG44300.1 Fis family transcriptional regulator [Syntrophotalea acetylenica]
MATHKNIGTDFDDFLAEEGILSEVEATAAKRVLAYQIQQEMENQSLTKTEMAAKMHTSRAAVNRLLDPQNTAVTLKTLEQATAALGKRLRIIIEDPVRH